MIADLHVHTTHSDGTFTPEEIVDLAHNKGLNAIAITDHDTISGIEPAIIRSQGYKNLYVIPGIEFSCTYLNEEVHILGYFIDYKLSDIINVTKVLKEERYSRGIKIISKLNNIGINISVDEVKKNIKGSLIGRPHIGRTLIEKKYVKSMEEAFNKYLGKNKPAYVERFKLETSEAINLIHKANGLAVLAHPGLIKEKNIINDLIAQDIDGIEVIHSKHSHKDVLDNIDLADAYGLFKTGGSDFHGDKRNGEYILGSYYVNLNHIEEMKGRIHIGKL
jgi:hypothetical protein